MIEKSKHEEIDTVLCCVLNDMARTCRYLGELASEKRPSIANRLRRAADGFEDIYKEAVKAGRGE